MSAFIVSREHVDVIVALALHGPRGQTVSPDTAWHGPSWSVNDPRDVEHWQEIQRTRVEHDSIVDAGRTDRTSASELGELLWAENVASVRARYSDADDARMVPLDFYNGYAYSRPAYLPTAVEGLSAIGCLEYQSCEHAEWRDSQAQRFLESLRDCLIGCLPGYRDAPWEWDADKLAEARRRQTMPPAKLAELEARERAESDAEQAAYLRLYAD